MIASACAVPAANPRSVPSVVISRTRSRRLQLAVTTLAAADTASSSDSAVWPLRRTSSSTVTRPCHGSSSCRTISSSASRRRLPVDPPQVVTHHVGTQGVEVLTAPAERGRVVGAGVRVVAAGVRDRHDLVDPGEHGELGDRGGGGRRRRDTERVGDDDVERTDPDDAALLGRQPVRGTGGDARFERSEQQVGAAGAGHRVEHAHDRCRAGAVVADRQARLGSGCPRRRAAA